MISYFDCESSVCALSVSDQILSVFVIFEDDLTG